MVGRKAEHVNVQDGNVLQSRVLTCADLAPSRSPELLPPAARHTGASLTTLHLICPKTDAFGGLKSPVLGSIIPFNAVANHVSY